MKRILVYGMTNNPGGIESYLINKMREAKSYNIVFDFITDFPCIAYKDAIANNGSKVFFIPPKSKGLVAHWKAINQILTKHPEYKCIYFNILDSGAALTMIPAHNHKLKIITHSHNGSTDKKLLHFLFKPLLNYFTDVRFSCSNLATDHMFGKRYRKRQNVHIIPNSINVNKFQYDNSKRNLIRNELNLTEDCKVILHVGRLSRQKNPFRLIDIFDSYHEQQSNTVLLHIGDGELKNQVIEYASGKPSSSKIFFLGTKPNISDYLSASDLFLLPSLYEGLPVILIEAQANGIPCIVSDTVSEESKLTSLVNFISLDEDNLTWANLINERIGNRNLNSKQALQAAGYDLNYPSINNKILMEYLYE